MRSILFGLIGVFAFSAPSAWAFPELIRRGYVSCTACHVSPNGGGVLTPYGRTISAEVLSHAGTEEEARFAYFVDTIDHLDLGGDIRVLQAYVDTPTARMARLIFMQGDLEAAAHYKIFTLAASAGYNPNAILPDQSWFLSRRFYAMVQPKKEISFRVGKFLYAYGLNMADHQISTRRGLNINDEGTESYNIEGAWLGKKANFFLTGILGQATLPSVQRETGFSAVASYTFGKTYRVGVSYLSLSRPGTISGTGRRVMGPFGALGFTEHFFLLSEFDFQNSDIFGWGGATYNRLDYEFIQGFHVFLTQELTRLQFSVLSSLNKAYGLGLQVFPRPHFEFLASWQLIATPNQLGYTDQGLLLGHFYF